MSAFEFFSKEIQKLKEAVINQDKTAFRRTGSKISVFFIGNVHYRTCRLAYRKGGEELLEKKIHNILQNCFNQTAAIGRYEMMLVEQGLGGRYII